LRLRTRTISKSFLTTCELSLEGEFVSFRKALRQGKSSSCCFIGDYTCGDTVPKDKLPQIRAQGRSAHGVGFQLRWDPVGKIDAPGFENLLISVHVGSAARLASWRDGRQHRGFALPGDIDIIPARTPSRWEIQDENDLSLLLSLPEALLWRAAEESGLDAARLEFRNRFQIRDTELEWLSWAMKRELEFGCPSGLLYMDGLTLAVASRLVARHSSISKPVAQSNGGLSGRRLKQVLVLIEEEIAEDLTLDRIASAAGLSASHAAALFRASIGMPIHQYVIHRRIERAKDLLLQSEMSIAEIALAAGFTHQSHMARHMRRLLGVAPATIRRLLRTAR